MKRDRSWGFLLLLALGAGVAPNAYRRSEAGASSLPPAVPSRAGSPETPGVVALRAALRDIAPLLGGAEPAAHPEGAAADTPAESKLRELLEGFNHALLDRQRSVAALARDYRETGRGRIFSLVTTVPDPDASSFDAYYDQALDAIQRAAAGEGYLPDRFFLPWREREDDAATASAGGEAPLAERLPGILLFRRLPHHAPGGAAARAVGTTSPADAPPAADLLIVLVVGEMPKRGLHHPAFAAAIDLTCALRAAPGDGLYVLGPHFSGTAFSLRLALDEHARRHVDPAPPVTVISGAAIDAANRGTIAFGTPGAPASVTFEATNIPSDQLQAAVLDAIADRLDDTSPDEQSRQIAMLIETGTQWAANLSEREAKGTRPPAKLRTFHFPLHVSQLRAQREKSRRDAPADSPIPTLRNRLELRLDRDRESADDLPAGSSLTPYTIEIMLHEQLIEIAREHIRFLGVAATDPTDLVFIVQEARKFCPGVQIFTLGSHALFAHPDLMRDLNGLLVASTYPLASLSTKRGETFANQGAEGIYNAFVALLARMSARESDHPVRFRDWKSPFDPGHAGAQIWLSMVSNGAIWPFHVEPPDPRKPDLLVREAKAVVVPPGASAGSSPELVGDLAIGFYWLLLVFALVHSGWLSTSYIHRRSSPGRAEGSEGVTYAVVMCGALLFTCIYWSLIALEVDPGPRTVSSLLAFAAGVVASAAVAATLLLAIGVWLVSPGALLGPGGLRSGRRHAAWAVLALIVTVTVGVLLAWPFVRDVASARLPSSIDVRLALGRTVQPMGGVSPAAPLLYAAAGLYLWGFSGRRRVRERSLLPPSTPFPGGEGIWAHKLTELATRIWSGHTDWMACREEVIAIGIVSLPCIFFWHELIPTFESAAFDPLFKAAFLLLVVAVVAGAGRLVAAWRQLQRLLRRIAGHPMIDAYYRAGTDGSPWLRLDVRPEIPAPAEIDRALRVADLAAAGEPAAPSSSAASAPPRQTLRQRLEVEADALGAARLAELHGEHAAEGDPARTHAILFRFSGLLFTALERLWQAGHAVPVGKDGEPKPLEELAGDDRDMATAELIVARQVMTLIRFALGRLRGLMTFVSAGALLLVFAVESYPFHPIRFVSVFVWSIALGGMGTILVVVFGVERDAVLSRMAKTRPGHIDLNASFVSKVLMYGFVPASVLLASAFPEVGDVLFSWLGPLVRAFH